ncbi:MAG: DNA mismatch repair endonuclease MutL [Clostridiales bacterium]|nr:DNA mismatch repair endonuclease MutL [Clostridiales bacterium]
MAEIRRLSSEIIGKIAAGEVVERPASVVKELVENAIDAGSTHVTVELRGGGTEYIRISDNGKGIPSGQIRLAFERHATSKLEREEQLYDIRTLGFRGEALASVAAVAKVTCTSRTADEDYGIKCKVEGGQFADIRQAASPVGTTFVVEDLFYNTPVRRKFLKKPATEAGLVADYMLRLILSHPEISFRFVSQGKTIYHSVGDGKLESALFAIYGKESFKQMLPVKGNENGVLLTGYVGVGELSRGNRQQQSFFINGRFFRSAFLSRAVEAGCEGRVMIGKFPMCALFLEMPYQQVDVNVHPNKLEVRFQNELAVAEAVKNLVYDSLHRETLSEKLMGEKNGETVKPAEKEIFSVVSLPGAEILSAEKEKAPHGFTVLNPEAAVDTPPPVAFKPFRETEPYRSSSNLRSSSAPVPVQRAAQGFGEKKNMETEPGDYSILKKQPEPKSEMPVRSSLPDSEKEMPEAETRHVEAKPAAKDKAEPLSLQKVSEEVLPSSLTKQDDASVQEGPSQLDFLPVQDETPALSLLGIAFDTYWIFQTGDRLLFVDQHAAHERILYDRLMTQMEGEQLSQQLLSPRLVQLSPSDMALVEEISQFLKDSGFEVEMFDERNVAVHAIPTLFGVNEDPQALLLETLDQWQESRGSASQEKMRRQVAQMACKHAIKGGDKLNEEQIRLFLQSMLESDSIPTCPHGRPIVTEMTRYQLEKRFKRT